MGIACADVGQYGSMWLVLWGKWIDQDEYISRLESERKQEQLENLKKLRDEWRRSSQMKSWIKPIPTKERVIKWRIIEKEIT